MPKLFVTTPRGENILYYNSFGEIEQIITSLRAACKITTSMKRHKSIVDWCEEQGIAARVVEFEAIAFLPMGYKVNGTYHGVQIVHEEDVSMVALRWR